MRLALALVIVAVAAPARGEGRGGRMVRVEAAPAARAWVEGGLFAMGTDPQDVDALYNECRRVQNLGHNALGLDLCAEWRFTLERRALREVQVDGFWIDRREVSVAEYRACVHAGACALEPLVAGDPRYVVDAWPQVNVERDEAGAFCAWRGGRLPTEAEWEKAARGTDFRTWPWGQERADDDFNHGQHRVASLLDLEEVTAPMQRRHRTLGDPDPTDGHAILAPPGSYAGGAGPYGTFDQAGNVAEWVLDAWSPRGFDELPVDNPYRQPMTAHLGAMIRGGSWRDPPFVARTDVPHYVSLTIGPAVRLNYVGFRCVYTPTVPRATQITPTPTP